MQKKKKRKEVKKMKRKNHVREIVRTTDGYLSGKSENKKPRYGVILYQRDDNCLIISKIMSKKRKSTNRVAIKPSKNNGLKTESLIDYKLYTGRKNNHGKYSGFKIRDFQKTGYRIGLLDLLKTRFAILKDPTRRKIVKSWKRHYK